MINTRIHVDDSDFALEDGLFTNGYEFDIKKIHGHVCKDDFKEFGSRIGVSSNRIDRLMLPFIQRQEMVNKLINNSFLDGLTKKAYRQHYETRRNHLNRYDESENDRIKEIVH